VERLVQRQLQVQRPAVQGDVAVVRSGKVDDGDLAHPEVALHAVGSHGSLDLVQERIVERPEVSVRDRHLERHLVGALGDAPTDRRHVCVLEAQGQREVAGRLLEQLGCHHHAPVVDVGGEV